MTPPDDKDPPSPIDDIPDREGAAAEEAPEPEEFTERVIETSDYEISLQVAEAIFGKAGLPFAWALIEFPRHEGEPWSAYLAGIEKVVTLLKSGGDPNVVPMPKAGKRTK